MDQWKERTSLLFGEDKMNRLKDSHVLVVGVGGVGAYAAEMIVRAGVGEITIVDGDDVQPSNINRQLPALHSSIGLAKVELLRTRFLDINPELKIHAEVLYIKDDAVGELLDRYPYDFVVDAIDTLAPKCFLIAESVARNYKIISSMGAGAKTDITKIAFTSIWKTINCNLSKSVRKRLRKMGVSYKLPVVYSSEIACDEAIILIDNERNKKSTCGTVSYMPAVFGCYLAEYVLRNL